MDSAQAPLISDDSRDRDEHYEADDADTASVSDNGKPTETRPGIFVLLLTFAAGISGLLFGCRHRE